MNDVEVTAILNYLQATADDAMGMEPGDRAMCQAAHNLIQLQSSEGKKLRKALQYINDEALDLNEAEETARQALATVSEGKRDE